ncbi:UNVERIFIED_CONTAM: hypothetical protein Sradi_7119100 [Sesamum radiatum]|uniref:DUF4283 domain-containing protein n=1 Tax=Sesamum radiatum TaxID=300843 RepID=A0AAW2IZV0_SESRA
MAAMEEVIEGGPWLFHGQAIVLQKWEPGLVLRKLQHTQVPVWIKLRHLPVELWTTDGLSIVASGVGKPLYPDAITRACTRLDFARVCVMLDISAKLLKHIVIMVPKEDGSEVACKVDVEYEWLPPKCTTCHSLGHSIKDCPTTKPKPPPVSVYVQKPTGSHRFTVTAPRIAHPTGDASGTARGAVWNVRGLNRRDHQVSVTDLITEHCLHFIGLLETRVAVGNVARVQRGLLPHWCYYVDYGGPGNRVWLAWDSNFVDVTILKLVPSLFIVLCLFVLSTCLGYQGAADEFRCCLQDTGLIHVPMHGERFTWHNCSGDARSLWKRLDRLLVNDRWLEQWPDTTYVSLSARTSDHSPLVLRGDTSSRSTGMFRFDNYLARSTEFIPSVRSIWRHHIVGSAMYAVTRKLKALKPIFRAQRQRKGDLSTNVSLAKGFLESAQTLLAADRHCPTLLHLEFCCKLVFRLASRLEQKMLHQRAKMAWLKDGDQCSRIFFRKVAKRRASKRVFQINTADGRPLTSQPEVTNEFIRYYEELLGGSARDSLIDLRYLRPWARHILTVDEAEALVLPVSPAEIKQAIFDIDETRAPPDGYSAGFYKAACR